MQERVETPRIRLRWTPGSRREIGAETTVIEKHGRRGKRFDFPSLPLLVAGSRTGPPVTHQSLAPAATRTDL